jgi:hypothetical protein
MYETGDLEKYIRQLDTIEKDGKALPGLTAEEMVVMKILENN